MRRDGRSTRALGCFGVQWVAKSGAFEGLVDSSTALTRCVYLLTKYLVGSSAGSIDLLSK